MEFQVVKWPAGFMSLRPIYISKKDSHCVQLKPILSLQWRHKESPTGVVDIVNRPDAVSDGCGSDSNLLPWSRLSLDDLDVLMFSLIYH